MLWSQRVGIQVADGRIFVLVIRSCFFKADKSKIVDCVSISAATQHIEAPIRANKSIKTTKAGFVVKINLLRLGLQFQASSSPLAADMPAVGIFDLF